MSLLSMSDRISKFQNTQRSLMWGVAKHSPTEAMFVVKHRFYPTYHWFVVSEDFVVSKVTEDHKIVVLKKCRCEKEVLKYIAELLAKWYPAKGV